MKKVNFIVFLVCCMMTCNIIHAQQPNEEKYRPVYTDLLFVASSPQHHLLPMAFDTNFGVRLSKALSFFAHGELGCGLNYEESQKNYFAHVDLGGGIAYNLAAISGMEEDWLDGFEVRAMVAHTLGKSDWQYTLYEVGLQQSVVKNQLPVMGIGFRHYSSHSISMQNMNVIYVSVGFRL